MIYASADTHFFHKNILKYCNRPFDSVEEMNQQLIAGWNSVVSSSDSIWHLGDFAFCNANKIVELLEQLNGTIHLIRGNHDRHHDENSEIMKAQKLCAGKTKNRDGAVVGQLGFASISDYREITVDGQMFVLSHYPFRQWNKSHRGSINLHGHCHGNMPGNSQQTDVGVDCWDYRPVSIPEILERLNTLPQFTSEAHHAQI